MPTATPRAERRWRAAVDEHQAALAAYLEAAERLPDEAWTRPWAPGKWTPAVITEHLAMTYRALVQEVRGGPGMKLKLTPLRRGLLKLLLLPHMLFHRTFPRGALAPREVRPESDGLPREQALAELRVLGEEFEREVERARAGGRRHVTHPYFGSIDLARGMRFAAVHIEHHTRQIASLR
ncbi:MAG: DinB family protein [Gemmatimonadetes bacterium]|nr:DinB family protein [Gemmatimonadota bacterium]